MGAVLMSEIKVFAKDYPMAPIDKFIPYANNARTHSKEQINKLRSIYRGIGYGDPVEVDENFTILSGHGRVEAAKAEFDEVFKTRKAYECPLIPEIKCPFNK